MTRSGKRNKLKQWLAGFFTPKGEILHTPDGPQLPSGSYNNVHYEVNNSFHVSGTGNVVTKQDREDHKLIVTKMMKLLSQHIICGAAHDDSARDPPPRCHPDTRVKILAQITAWFDGKAQQEFLLWLTGPAGVGKSAIVQTFAEHLAKNHFLGASVFISRLNRRDMPHGIFVTIAYQLAIRIEAYRDFIAERLRIDPRLVTRGVAAQFRAFIFEPFVEKKIGAGGKRWGILLDGLDELKGEDAQCEIIQLITTFVHEHHHTPLVWIVASRPEPHISNMFADDASQSYWSEYIPIDSTEACNDVERFFRSSFEKTRKKYQQCVPRDWPTNTDFLKLTTAAAGLFVYAEVVMQFIKDPTQGDPAARLEILLLVIERSNFVPTADNPFVHLDALYNEILSSIPSRLWPSTKRLLNYMIHAKTCFEAYTKDPLPWNLQVLRGMAIILGLPLHVVYTCLLKCHSTLKVPDLEVSHKKSLTFLHASFADYLKDSARSGNFHIGDAEDITNDVALRLLGIWHECSGGTDSKSVESSWRQYCLRWDDKAPSKAIAKFHANIFPDFISCVRMAVLYTLHTQTKDSKHYALLQNTHMIRLCYSFDPAGLVHFVHALGNTRDTPDTELLRQVWLKDLKVENLSWEEMSPVRAYDARRLKSTPEEWSLHQPRSSTELETFVSELEIFQKRSPGLKVLIFGGVREGRVAAFRHMLPNDRPYGPHYPRDFVYYIIPYPE